MFNAKPSGTETLDFVIGQDFRQVGLLKNPQVDSAGHGGQPSTMVEPIAFTASTGRALKGLNFSAVKTFGEDKTILGATSGAKHLLIKTLETQYSIIKMMTLDLDISKGETVNETDGTGQVY